MINLALLKWGHRSSTSHRRDNKERNQDSRTQHCQVVLQVHGIVRVRGHVLHITEANTLALPPQ